MKDWALVPLNYISYVLLTLFCVGGMQVLGPSIAQVPAPQRHNELQRTGYQSFYLILFRKTELMEWDSGLSIVLYTS